MQLLAFISCALSAKKRSCDIHACSKHVHAGGGGTKASQYLQANFAQPVLKGAEKVQKVPKGGKKKEMSKQTCKFM